MWKIGDIFIFKSTGICKENDGGICTVHEINEDYARVDCRKEGVKYSKSFASLRGNNLIFPTYYFAPITSSALRIMFGHSDEN